MKCKVHGSEMKVLSDKSHVCLICSNPWYGEIWDIIHKKNKNVLIVVEGESGDGKSYFSLKTGEALDSTFRSDNLRDRCVFKPKDFLKQVSAANLDKGNVIVVEEGGTQADHRKWFSFNNMAINYILQTFRYQNLIVIFNVPIIDYIDSDSRKMFKFHVQALKVDHKRNYNVVKIKRQSYNSTVKKLFRKFLRYKINGQWVRVQKFRTKKPSVKMCHEYEKLHKEFKSELAKELYDQVTLMEKEEQAKIRKKKLDIDEAIKKVISNKDKYVRFVSGRPIADISLIEREFKVGRALGARIKKGVEDDLGGRWHG